MSSLLDHQCLRSPFLAALYPWPLNKSECTLWSLVSPFKYELGKSLQGGVCVYVHRYLSMYLYTYMCIYKNLQNVKYSILYSMLDVHRVLNIICKILYGIEVSIQYKNSSSKF